MRHGPPYSRMNMAPEGARGGGVASRSFQFASAPHQACEAIQRAVRRLIEVVDQETAALRERTATDLTDFNARKSHGLLELDHAAGLLNGAQPDSGTLVLLRELRDKLDANSRTLAMHIEAVREIAGVITDTIREADSDGTYTNAYRSKG
jgi:hypothetical protein